MQTINDDGITVLDGTQRKLDESASEIGAQLLAKIKLSLVPTQTPDEAIATLDEIIESHSSDEELLAYLREMGTITLLLRLMRAQEASDSNEESPLTQKAASAISYISGHMSAGPRVRRFRVGTSVVKIHEAPFSEAALGWETWNSAVVFAHWISSNRHLVSDKRVLELGCGTALCGLACAKSGASHVTLTDFHPKVLEYAEKNIVANGLGETTSAAFMDWVAIDPSLPRFDVLVGSDICYNADHPDILSAVVDRLLPPKPAEGLFMVAVMKTRPEVAIFETKMTTKSFVLKFRHEFRFVSQRASNKETLHFLYGYSR